MFISRSPSGAIRKDRHGCAWADVNQDGLLDFYCSVGANHGKLTDKANELWMQQPGGGFLNKAAAYGVTDPLGPGRQVTFLDVNHDPFCDLYVTNHSATGWPTLAQSPLHQSKRRFLSRRTGVRRQRRARECPRQPELRASSRLQQGRMGGSVRLRPYRASVVSQQWRCELHRRHVQRRNYRGPMATRAHARPHAARYRRSNWNRP